MKTPPPKRSAIGLTVEVPGPGVVAVPPVTVDECCAPRPTVKRRTLPPVKFPVGKVRLRVQNPAPAGVGEPAGFAGIATTSAAVKPVDAPGVKALVGVSKINPGKSFSK